MGKGKSKQAKIKQHPSSDKTPRIASDPDSFNKKNPAWRISKIQFVDPFGWHNLDFKQIDYIRTKLSDFETMTWNQIFVEAKKQNHSVYIDQLSTEARNRLDTLDINDIDQLWSLKLSGRQRVWGILDQGVFDLLWWDPQHLVCRSNKKHT
ncbi:MAG: hypothetical protein RLZZ04_4633 [Cyanobacteriota bacterium]